MKTGLMVGDFDDSIVQWMFDPFDYHQSQLAKKLDLRVRQHKTKSNKEVDAALRAVRPDILFYMTSWEEPVESTVAYLKGLYEQPNRPKIVFLDYFDQCTTSTLPAMEYVDLYVRKQIFRNKEDHNKDFLGKNNIADFAAREQGLDLGGWEFGSKMPPGTEDRLIHGWNLATGKSVSRISRSPLLGLLNRPVKKTLDLTCRVSSLDGEGSEHSYFHIHRVAALDAVQKLEGKFNVAHNANGERITFKQFQRELKESRLALSPFGWGELTDRDFRIVNAHTLLVKPDMSHILTEPDIYRAGETYAPVKWDFSDLEDVCEYYLTHPAEARDMTQNATRVFRDYFKQGLFVDKMQEIMQKLGY